MQGGQKIRRCHKFLCGNGWRRGPEISHCEDARVMENQYSQPK